MRRLALAAVVLMLAVAVTPSVDASHTMGHRYLVFGRLLDANAMPIQNTEVTLKISDRGTSVASIITRTDCKGDFASWQGRAGSDPPGGGKIEQNQNPAYGRYIAFHFHDPDLSNQLDVLVTIGEETKTLDFHSRDRQTSVRQQFGTAFPMACPNYDEFNQTFLVRAAALNEEELSYRTEASPKARRVEATIGNQTLNGTADFNGAFDAVFENLTAQAGDELRLQVAEVGTRTHQLTQDDVKYRRIDQSFVIGENVGGVLDDFKYVGVGLIVIAILIGLFMGANKMRDKMAERKLRETSTRRRFRRDKQP